MTSSENIPFYKRLINKIKIRSIMQLFYSIIILLTSNQISYSQTKIIGNKINNLPPKSITLEWHDQALSSKVSLILINALPKMIEERHLLHKWDKNGAKIKIYNQLDSSIIEEINQYFINDRVHKALTNQRKKIPYKEKLDCLNLGFRYDFDFISRKEICDIIVSPELQIGKELFRYFKIQESNDHYWIVKVKYLQNWNDDCYTTEITYKNEVIR